MTPEGSNQPATQQQLREALDHAVESITTAIRAEIRAAEERGQEFAQGIESNLLMAFHGHAKGQTARLPRTTWESASPPSKNACST
jgi:hypothetical protein